MPVKNWTETEDATIRRHWGKLTQSEIGQLILRHPADISRRGKEIGLPRLMQRWRPEEDDVLRRLYRTMPQRAIARMLGRKVPQVSERAKRLGVNVPGGRGRRRG